MQVISRADGQGDAAAGEQDGLINHEEMRVAVAVWYTKLHKPRRKGAHAYPALANPAFAAAAFAWHL